MYFLLGTCEHPGVLRTLYFATLIEDVIFTLVPIVLIVITMFDFSKAVVAGDVDKQTKTANVIPKRILYAVIIFSVPWIIKILVKLMDGVGLKIGSDYTTCLANAKGGDFDYYENLLEEEERVEAERLAKERNENVYEGSLGKEHTSNAGVQHSGGSSHRLDSDPGEGTNPSTGEEYSNETYNEMANSLMNLVYGEIGRDNSDGKYGQKGLAWCAMFVRWSLENTSNNGINLFNDIIQKEHTIENPASALCSIYVFAHSSNLHFYYSKHYAAKYNPSDGSYVPKAGDIIYFQWDHQYNGGTDCMWSQKGHIGFVDYLEKGRVHTVEGNASNKVAKRDYDLDSEDIVGYGSWYKRFSSGGGSSTDTSTNNDIKIKKEAIENYIKNNVSDESKISVGYYNINNGYTYKYNGDKVYYGASTIKTLDALYYYNKKYDDLNTSVSWKDDAGNSVSTVKEAVGLAIKKSCNSCHLNLINRAGVSTEASYATSIGVSQSIANSISNTSGKYGNTNIDTQFAYLKKLYSTINDKNVSDSNGRDELKSWFLNSDYNCLKEGVSFPVMTKYGSYYNQGDSRNIFHNAGIVLDGSNPYIVVVLTDLGKEADCGVGATLIKEISKLVNDLHVSVKSGTRGDDIELS